MDQGSNKNNVENEDSIMGSIAALRQILMIDTPTKGLLSEKQTSIALQQTRNEERRMYEYKISQLETKIANLEEKIKTMEDGASKEKSLHQTLEKSYEALSKHKKELSMQLELVSKSRDSLEQKLDKTYTTLQEERAKFERERDAWMPQMKKWQHDCHAAQKVSQEWEGRYLESSKASDNLQKQVNDLQAQIESNKARHEATIQSHLGTQNQLEKRIQELADARRSSEQVLQAVNKEIDNATTKEQPAIAKPSDESSSPSTTLSTDTIFLQIMEKVLAAGTNDKTIVQELETQMQAIQKHMKKLAQDNATLSAQLRTTKHSTVKKTHDLASSREDCRETKVDLEETKTELEDSKARIVELENELQEASSPPVSSSPKHPTEEMQNGTADNDADQDSKVQELSPQEHPNEEMEGQFDDNEDNGTSKIEEEVSSPPKGPSEDTHNNAPGIDEEQGDTSPKRDDEEGDAEVEEVSPPPTKRPNEEIQHDTPGTDDEDDDESASSPKRTKTDHDTSGFTFEI